MSEKMKLLITGIKESKWGDKTYYNCTTVGGTEYTTTDEQVKQYLDKEHEFDINSKEDKNGNMKFYINFTKAGGGGKSWGGGGGGKSYGQDPVITAKDTILMQLVEIVKIYQKSIDTPEKAIDFVKANMDTLWDAFKYKVPEIKPQESTGPVTHPLSKEKQTIIWKNMQGLKFRAKDLIDFAGKAGIEIHYNPEEDRAKVSELSEEQGQKLINALADEGDIPF